MDLLTILKGNLPSGVELTDQQLTALVDAINKEQGLHFVPKDQYNSKAKEVLDLNESLKAEKLKATNDEAWEKKYNDLKTDFSDYKKGVETKQTEKQQKAVVKGLLTQAGANPEAIDLLVSAILDRPVKPLEFEGEGDNITLKDWETVLEPVTAKYGGLFGEVSEEGNPPATPPTGGQAKTYTREQIKKMTPEEINANIDDVNRSLKEF